MRDPFFCVCMLLSPSFMAAPFSPPPLRCTFQNQANGEGACVMHLPLQSPADRTGKRTEIDTCAPCRRPLPMVIRFQAGEVFAFVIPFSPLPVHSSSPTHFPFCGVFPPIGRKWFSHSMQDGSMQELLSIAYDRLALWFELQIKPCKNWPGLRSFSSRTTLYLASRARV